jgi:Protein of unknown function (DUF2934)
LRKKRELLEFSLIESQNKEIVQRMEIETQEQIRELAYRIWQAEGYPHGSDVQHWLKAEAIWQEEHRPKSKPKRSKPLRKTKSRKTSTTEKEL